ncbi:MAG: 50S ribosomal protein L35 [Alphaproteobacteria bacterium]
MPKLKTKSGAKKRFHKTATGKIKMSVAHKRHRLISKPKKMKRKARGTTVMADCDATIVKKYMPYL